jgi:hypothetical protein
VVSWGAHCTPHLLLSWAVLRRSAQHWVGIRAPHPPMAAIATVIAHATTTTAACHSGTLPFPHLGNTPVSRRSARHWVSTCVPRTPAATVAIVRGHSTTQGASCTPHYCLCLHQVPWRRAQARDATSMAHTHDQRPTAVIAPARHDKPGALAAPPATLPNEGVP